MDCTPVCCRRWTAKRAVAVEDESAWCLAAHSGEGREEGREEGFYTDWDKGVTQAQKDRNEISSKEKYVSR